MTTVQIVVDGKVYECEPYDMLKLSGSDLMLIKAKLVSVTDTEEAKK